MTFGRRVLNVVYAMLAYGAGFLVVALCVYLLFMKSASPGNDGWAKLGVLIFLFFSAGAAIFGAVFVIVTVLMDDWTLHRLAPLQGILAALAGGYLSMSLGAVRYLPITIAVIGGALVVVLPWLVYRPVRAAHLRRVASADSGMTPMSTAPAAPHEPNGEAVP